MKSRVLLLLASVVVAHAQNRHIKAESSALPKLDCTSPGFYTFGCERVFAHCDENGNSRFFTCRNSLFIFDRYTHRCENIRAVVYCNGAEAQATKTWIRERQLGASSFASHKISGTGYTSNSYSASSSSNSIAAQTGGPLATAAPPIEADVPSPDFDCDGKTDGIYEKEAGVCRTRFWVCSNGAKHEYACPKGLFFQSATQQCDWRRNIVACGGTLPTATSAPAQDAQRTPAPYGAPTTQASYTGNTLNENIGQAQPPAPPPALDHGAINSYSQQQPQPSIKLSCTSKTDGYYADGPCLNYYVICAAGAAQRLTCPSGLVYNEAKNACDFEDWCRNPPPPTTTNAPVAQAPPAYDTTKCSTLNNGTHASGPCSENYYLCWNGATSVAMCTKGLVYNDYNGQCDYRDNVISCNLGKAQDQPLPPPVIATTPAAPIKIDTFCSDKADGLYGQQCSSYFYHCQQRATTKMLCPVGLFFNEQSKSCDHNVNILACNPALSAAQPPAPPPRTVVQTVQTSSYNQQNYGQQQQIVAPPPPPPTRPQQQFIQQAPLAANNYQQGSNYQQKTVITTQQRLVASPPAPPPPSLPKQSFDCTGKPNGFYAPTGCQKSFVQCNNGQAFIADCQGNLLWNAEKAQCDYSENILVCNPNAPRVQSVAPPAPPPPPPSSSAQNYNQYTSQTVQQRDALINPPAPSTPQYSCNGVPEGVYEVSPCSPYYAHCHNGFSNVAACIAPLIYNSDNGQCDYRENVPSCNGGRRPPPPPPSNDQPVINSLNGFSCLNQPDSFYASGGCSSTYYACHGGALKAMDCSAGLVFNEQNQLCDYPESVPTCVARSNARSNGNVITRGYKVYQTIGNDQQSNSQIPPSAGSCLNRPDGHYATGCSSTYISCHGGAVDIMTCPGNLFFNESTGACVYPEAVSGCSRGGIQQDSASTSGPTCLNRVDGFYAQGCSSSYIACHGGAVDIMTCPGNLFFNESTGACVHPEQVPGCRGSGSTTVSQTQTVIQQDQSTVTSMNGFSCLSRSDGNYAQGCSSTYFACTSGALRVMECTAGLFFNQDTQFCVYPASVPQCNGAQSPTEFSCIGKAEGVYALGGCNKQYATCHSGTTFISECYGELVFSPLTLRCDYKQQVAGCSGIQPQQAAQSQPLPPAALFNCANLQNGLYSKVPCREWYIHCQNGVMFENTCPGELIFNQQTGQCDFRSNVKECANPGSIAPPAPPPSNNIENDAPATPEPLTAGERTFCANKANGIYSEGCKQRYYVCTAQSTYAFICPRGLVFSQFKQACDFSANVPDCTDYVPPPPAQSPREY